jgi:hypothetical protein
MGFMGLGELPREYNRKVHGPYDPAIFYGKSKFNFLAKIFFLKSLTDFVKLIFLAWLQYVKSTKLK